MYSKASDGKYYDAVSNQRHQLEYIVLSLFSDIRKFHPQIDNYFKAYNRDLLKTEDKSIAGQLTIYGLTAEIIEQIIKNNEYYINPKSKFIADTDELNKILQAFNKKQAIREIDKISYIKKALTRYNKSDSITKVGDDDYIEFSDSVCGNRLFYLKGKNYNAVLAEIVEQLREDLDIGADLSNSHGLPNPDKVKNTFILSDKMIKRVESQWRKANL